MKRILSVFASLAFVCCAVLSCQNGTDGQLYKNARPLLLRLNSELAKYLNDDPESPDYGGLLCPGENLYHTRAAEAVWPFSYEYKITGNSQRMEQAIRLGNWLFRQQKDGGQWVETPEEWTGTTTDQLLMLLLSYPILEPALSEEERIVWLCGMEKAADYLTAVMSNKFASINYCATTTATLAEAYLRFGKEIYRDKARSLARMVVAKMNREGFIEGEGTREGKYKYGVDLGYNLEMSLWGLARYASRLDDKLVWEAVCKATANHFYLIYPDGMLDASAGIRSNKWTIFGSGTSDGCHPLFAQLSGENPAYITAAVRNINKIGECFSDCGLLGHGPDHDSVMSGAPCVYPTFTKAKSMAMAMDWVVRDTEKLPPLPCDSDMLKVFSTLGMAIIRKGDFCGTVTTYNYVSPAGPGCKYMHRPTGGAMTALWIDGYGLFEASSQTEYHRWEPMSFPEMPEIKPLTPRIEVEESGRTYTNLYEFQASFHAGKQGKSTACSASGHLKDRTYTRCGVAYSLDYTFSGKSLTKEIEIRHQTYDGDVRIIEPVIVDSGTRLVRNQDNSVSIFRNGKEIVLSADCSSTMSFELDEASSEEYRQVYPSLRAVPVVITVPVNPESRIETLRIIITSK